MSLFKKLLSEFELQLAEFEDLYAKHKDILNSTFPLIAGLVRKTIQSSKSEIDEIKKLLESIPTVFAIAIPAYSTKIVDLSGKLDELQRAITAIV